MHARLAKAAPVGARRELEQAGAVDLGDAETGSDLQQSLSSRGPVRARGEPLAEDDHDLARARLLALAAQEGGQPGERRRVGRGDRREALDLRAVRLLGERGGEARGEGRSGAGAEAHRQGRGRLERARGRHRKPQLEPVAAHALAQAKVQDRGVVDGIRGQHEHRVGELEVRDPGLQARIAERAMHVERQGAAAPRVQVRRGERLPHQT